MLFRLGYVTTKYEKLSPQQWCQKLVNQLASVPILWQVVKYSEVRVSNPQGLCLYLDWCKPNLKARDKEIIDRR